MILSDLLQGTGETLKPSKRNKLQDAEEKRSCINLQEAVDFCLQIDIIDLGSF